MGKSFKGFSKAISLFLAVAMVVTMLPTSAYAADIIADDSAEVISIDDTIVEEASDTVISNDATALSDDDSSIDTQEASDKEVEDLVGNTAGEGVTPDKYASDVLIAIKPATGVKVLDRTQKNEGADPVVEMPKCEATTGGEARYKDDWYLIEADSTNGYSFILAPDMAAGKKLADTVIKDEDNTGKKVSFYGDWTNLEYKTNKWYKGADAITGLIGTTELDPDYGFVVVDPPVDDNEAGTKGLDRVGVPKSDKGYSVTDYTPVKGFKEVTISSDLLKDVIAKFQDKNGEWVYSAMKTGTPAKKTALDERPVLTITLADAEDGTFTFNQPKTKGSVEMLNNVAPDKRTAKFATPGAATASKEIENITLKSAYTGTHSFKNAKVTMTIKDKNKENVKNIDGLYETYSMTPELVKKIEFPYTIKGAGYVDEATELKPINAGDVSNAVPFEYDITNHKLIVSQYIVNEAYTKGYTIDIEFDFSEDVVTEYNLSVDKLSTATSGDTQGYVLSGTTKIAKVEKTEGTPFATKVKENEEAQIYVTGVNDSKGNPREITNIFYSVGTSDVKKKLVISGGTSATGSLDMSEVKADVKFFVETVERVTVDPDTNPKFNLYTLKGDKIATGTTKTITDEPFKFTIQATGGTKVSSVTYKIGDGQFKAAEVDEDGVYTTDPVNNALTLKVTGETDVNKFFVSRNVSENNLHDVPQIQTTGAEAGKEIIKGETRIFSAVRGDADTFLGYWNNLYGTSYNYADDCGPNGKNVQKNKAGNTDGDPNQFLIDKNESGYYTKPVSQGGAGLDSDLDFDDFWGITIAFGDDVPAADTYNKVGFQITQGGYTENIAVSKDRGYIGVPAKNKASELCTIFSHYATQSLDFTHAFNLTEDFTIQPLVQKDNEDVELLGTPCTMNFGSAKVAGSNVATVEPTGYDGRDSAIVGQPYYFDVEVLDGRIITDVFYTMGDSDTIYEAEFVKGNKYCDDSETVAGVSTWKTKAATGDIHIHVETSTFSYIKFDGKSKAEITLDTGDVLDEATDIAAVDNTEELDFLIESTASNIKIKKVNYSFNNGTTWVLPEADVWKPDDTAAVYTFDEEDLGDGTEKTILITAYTEETVDPSKYSIEFTNGDETGKKEGEQLVNTYDASGKLIGQALNLSVGRPAELTENGVILKDSKGNKNNNVSYNNTSYKVAKVKDSVKVLTNATAGGSVDKDGYVKKSDGKADNVKGYKAGSDVITAEVKLASADYDNNEELYTATLETTVSDDYTGLYIKSNYDAIDDAFVAGETHVPGHCATLTIRGVDVRTGDDVQIGASEGGITKIEWAFKPDISTKVSPTHGFAFQDTTDENKYKLKPTIDANGVIVAATSTANETITVEAKLYKGDELFATLTKDLSVIEAEHYVVVPTVSIAGSASYLDDEYYLETLASGENTATISYKVYKQLKDNVKNYIWPGCSEEDIEKALNAGDYAEVTSGITYDVELVHYDAAKHESVKLDDLEEPYASLTGTTSPFTVKALKKNSGNDYEYTTNKVLVNGILADAFWWKFIITDRVPKKDVEFYLNGEMYGADGKYVDDDGKPTTDADKAKVVVRTLSDTYLNGYGNTKSIMAEFKSGDQDRTKPATEYTTGVILTDVGMGAKITLPKESDFTATNKDPRAVLVGWYVSSGAVAPADDVTSWQLIDDKDTEDPQDDVYAYVLNEEHAFAPGDEVVVGDGATFKAIWAPKYALATLNGITTPALEGGAAIVGGGYWDDKDEKELAAETFETGKIVNGSLSEANSYLDPTDPNYDGTTKTRTNNIYKTAITKASIDVELETALYAFTPYALEEIDGNVFVAYRPVNITSGYTLGYIKDAKNTSNLTFSGTKIVGDAKGTSSQLKATLTENGTTWEFLGVGTTTDPSGIIVDDATVYTAAFDNKPLEKDATKQTKISDPDTHGTYSIVNPLTTLSLEESQAAVTINPYIINIKSPTRPTLTDANCEFHYALDRTGVVEIEKGTNGAVTITPKAKGTAKLEATFTDETGVTFTASLDITVVEDQVVIDVTGKKATDAFDGKALGGNDSGIEFYVAAYAKNDTNKATKLDGSWEGLKPDGKNKVAAPTAGKVVAANDGTGRMKATFSTAQKDLDTDKVTVTFKGTGENAITYTKDVEVTTHYNLVLTGGTGSKGNPKTFITVDGERVIDEEKSALAEEDIPAATKTIEITTANKKVDEDKTVTYDIDLSPYGIEKTTYNTTEKRDVVLATVVDFWYYNGNGGDSCTSAVKDDASELYNRKDVAFTKDEIKDLEKYYGHDEVDEYVIDRGIAFAGNTDYCGNGVLPLYAETYDTPITKAQPTLSTVTLENASGKEYKAVEVSVAPAGSTQGITVVPEDQGFFKFAKNNQVATAGAGWLTATGAYTMGSTATDTDENYTTFTDRTHGNVAPKLGVSTRTDVFSLGMVADGDNHPKAGATTLHIYATADDKNKLELSTVTLYVNGLNWVDATTTNYIENGEIVKGATRTVGTNTYVFDEEGKQVIGSKVVTLADGSKVLVLDGVLANAGVRSLENDSYLVGENGAILSGWQTYEGNTYYGDPENSNKLVDGLQKIGNKSYYFKSLALVKAPATANEYAQIAGTNYYTNKDGEVAMGGIFKVDGKNRLFREDGKIVSYTDADVVGGKITVAGVTYVIDPETNEASEDDRLGFVSTLWGSKPKADTVPKGGVPTITAKVKYTSQKGKDYGDNYQREVTVTVVKNAEKSVEGKKAVFTATADLSAFFDSKYETKMTTESKDYVYGIDKDGNLTDSTDSESGDTPSEPIQPENRTNINLFNTGANKEIIKLELPDGANIEKATGKWKDYYAVADDGTVTVKVSTAKDLKKAATTANSLIVIPIFGAIDGGTDVEIGEFEYSLPVFYQKPTLKLTATNGTVNVSKKDDDGKVVAQTLSTTVTEKKSTGAFEALDVAEAKLDYNLKKGTKPEVVAGDKTGEVNVTATGKASGKISVKLDEWIEAVEVSYTVKEAKKNVLTGSAKTIYMNLNAASGENAQAAQEFTLLVNGSEDIDFEGDPVSVVTPNKWAQSGLEITEGYDSDKKQLTASTIKIAFADGATPKKGSYTVKFTTGSKATKNLVTYSLKISVSNLLLDEKAINLKKQCNMDLTTGQKMVLIPQLKGISGAIDYSSVSVDNDNFAVEGNEDLGQIWLSPAEGKTLSTKTNYTVKFTVNVAGVTCTKTMKFKPAAKKPTVKVDKVTFPKTKFADGTARGKANVLCTYKQGNKKFTIAPNPQKDADGNVTTQPVTFMIDNKTKAPEVEGEEGWYKIEKANVLVKYDADEGTILVKPNGTVAKPKNGSVKVWLNFNGVTIKKTMSIKSNNKK